MDREEYISNVKNSLTVIIGLAVLIKKRTDNEQIKEFCDVIFEEAQNIITDLKCYFSLKMN